LIEHVGRTNYQHGNGCVRESIHIKASTSTTPIGELMGVKCLLHPTCFVVYFLIPPIKMKK